MFAYSEDGQHFLGYRITSFGKVQVVYDCAGVYDHCKRAQETGNYGHRKCQAHSCVR